MRVEPLDGNFAIRQHGVIIARDLDERTACRFAAVPDLLAVCKMVVRVGRKASEELDYEMLFDMLGAAEAVVARVEGEQ